MDLELEWTECLGVGIAALDADHQVLFGSYNHLIETLTRQLGRRGFACAFGHFLNHADHHFIHEELVMRNIGYPEYSAHKAAHDRLRTDARDFAVNVAGVFTRSDLPLFARYMRHWLVNHIVVHDQKIGAFVERGWHLPSLALPECQRGSSCRQQPSFYVC